MVDLTVIPTASLVAIITTMGFVTADRAPAAEQHVAGMRVISSDATAHLLSLGVHKSVAIDLPGDIKDVLVTNKEIVDVVVRTKRQAYVVAQTLGQSNVFFFDADGRQIGALDIYVQSTTQPALQHFEPPAKVVTVYRGMSVQGYACSLTMCAGPEIKPPLPAGYTDVTYHSDK